MCSYVSRRLGEFTRSCAEQFSLQRRDAIEEKAMTRGPAGRFDKESTVRA